MIKINYDYNKANDSISKKETRMVLENVNRGWKFHPFLFLKDNDEAFR